MATTRTQLQSQLQSHCRLCPTVPSAKQQGKQMYRNPDGCNLQHSNQINAIRRQPGHWSESALSPRAEEKVSRQREFPRSGKCHLTNGKITLEKSRALLLLLLLTFLFSIESNGIGGHVHVWPICRRFCYNARDEVSLGITWVKFKKKVIVYGIMRALP